MVQPERAVAAMSRRKDGGITEGGDGIYQCGVFGGYFKFVGKSGSQQLCRGGVLVGIVTHEGGIVYAIPGTQGFRVEPTFGYDAVHRRCGTRIKSGDGRGTVGDVERIFRLAEHFPFP